MLFDSELGELGELVVLMNASPAGGSCDEPMVVSRRRGSSELLAANDGNFLQAAAL